MAYKLKIKQKKTDIKKKFTVQKFIEKEKHPKYAYFYGKEYKELLDKMNAKERKQLGEINWEIAESVGMTSALGILGMPIALASIFLETNPASFVIGSAGVMTEVGFTLRTKNAINQRRAFLEKIHKKYYGGK